MEKIERIDICTYGCPTCLGTSLIKIEEINPARTVQPAEAYAEAEHMGRVLKEYVKTDEFNLIVTSLRTTFLRGWADDLQRIKKEALSEEGISDTLLTLWEGRMTHLTYYGDYLIRHGDLRLRRAVWDEGITILEDAIFALWTVSGLERQIPVKQF